MYPTEEQLKKIESWEPLETKDLVEYIQLLWWPGDGYGARTKVLKNGVCKFELHTWGWSGNEDIIYSLRKNLFWSIFWIKSERGGHYYFEIRKEFWK